MGEVGQPARDSGRSDQVAGENEQRQRQQAEEVEAFKQRHADIGQREVDHDGHTYDPKTDHQKDGYTD